MERHHFEAGLADAAQPAPHDGRPGRGARAPRGATRSSHRREEDAQRIIATDDEVNDLQMEIDDRCLRLLATQTPLASDLRLITSAMKINADLERVGDQAVNIAERALTLIPHPPLKPLIDIPRMAQMAEKMIRDALDAFVEATPRSPGTSSPATTRWTTLKEQVFRELLTYMMADPGTIQRAFALILIEPQPRARSPTTRRTSPRTSSSSPRPRT